MSLYELFNKPLVFVMDRVAQEKCCVGVAEILLLRSRNVWRMKDRRWMHGRYRSNSNLCGTVSINRIDIWLAAECEMRRYVVGRKKI